MYVCIYVYARARTCMCTHMGCIYAYYAFSSRFPRKNREESVDKSVIESRCENGISADLVTGRCLVFRFAQ